MQDDWNPVAKKADTNLFSRYKPYSWLAVRSWRYLKKSNVATLLAAQKINELNIFNCSSFACADLLDLCSRRPVKGREVGKRVRSRVRYRTRGFRRFRPQ